MKKMKLGLALAMLFTAAFLHAEEIDFDYFYESLAEQGQWIELAPHGWVWSPDYVEAGWKPYGDGRWTYTDYGWTFESDEPWAWAVYHYGRWLLSDDYGWVWVPGTEWGPAWVAWRYGDDYVGWAPLPPAVGWSVSTGLVVGRFDFDVDLDWSVWIFVEPRWFAAPRLRDYHLASVRNREWMRRTKVVVRYPVVDRRIFNPGFPVRDAERHWGRKIERRRVVEVGRDRPAARDRDRVHVYKPVVRPRHTVDPRDLPGRRRPQTEDEVRRRQETERKRMDDYYDRQKREIRQPAKPEPPKKERRPAEKVRPRNDDDDAKRLNEREKKDRRALDNRQKLERERLKKQPRR